MSPINNQLPFDLEIIDDVELERRFKKEHYNLPSKNKLKRMRKAKKKAKHTV